VLADDAYAAVTAQGCVAVDAAVNPALAGAIDVKTPSPSDATATTAMRLKFVFVDICFLSIVEKGTFPNSALAEKADLFVISRSFWESIGSIHSYFSNTKIWWIFCLVRQRDFRY
jgi:hypothetical protein